MNSTNYKSERKMRGTQETVAEQLGVNRVTIARRETGDAVVTKEAWLALLALPKTLQSLKTEPNMARGLRVEAEERERRRKYKIAKNKV